MTLDPAWIPVAYALIGAVASGFAAWVSAKYAVKNAVKAVSTQVEEVHQQNIAQSARIEDVHTQVNGRMTEWMDQTKEHIVTAVAAALARGVILGEDKEHKKTGDSAESILLTAREAAVKVLEVASQEAKKIK